MIRRTDPVIPPIESDSWNPAPLMQNYMIKSVKMTKKSIFREQFSWKVRTFALEIVLNIISHDNR